MTKRLDPDRPKLRRPRRRLRCNWCRGPHATDLCKNPSGKRLVRQFGTLGPDREYVPPPGIEVPIWHLPNTANGDTLTAMKATKK